MDKFELQEDETIIGSGMMAHKHKKSVNRQPTRGTIYVTNRRICYYESWSNFEYMNLPISQIKGYESKSMLFVTFVNIYDRDNRCYVFSGFPAKNLQKWLENIGINKLQ